LHYKPLKIITIITPSCIPLAYFSYTSGVFPFRYARSIQEGSKLVAGRMLWKAYQNRNGPDEKAETF